MTEIRPSTELEQFLSTVTKKETEPYIEHFHRIAPKEPMEVFHRFLFAYASVHTTWQYNVKLYKELKALDTIPCKDSLTDTVKGSGAGLHKYRIEGVWSFRETFWQDARIYQKAPGESWTAFRNRLVKRMYALGYAKVSFALELCWPLETQAVCLDVHMLRHMGLGPSPTPKQYLEAEKKFVTRCRGRRIPPAIGGLLFWDRLKEQPSARYWSDCIHPVTETYDDSLVHPAPAGTDA